MAFFAVQDMHPVMPLAADGRQRLAAGLVALAAQALVALLLLLGAMQQVVTAPKGPPLVMADLPRNAAPDPSLAPPAPHQLHLAPLTVMAPDITIQTDAKTPDPVAAPNAAAPATSTLASAPQAFAGGGASAASGAAGASGGSGGYDINPYLARVAARIQGFLRLPYLPSATVRKQIPKVVVHLIWRRDGTVEKAEVTQSSGHSRIDDAAVEAVLRAQPLPPFPPEIKGERINGLIPVVFVYSFR